MKASFANMLKCSYPSFPTRERGLKGKVRSNCVDAVAVVPHAGTWIERRFAKRLIFTKYVVPHAGTWIESMERGMSKDEAESFPTRERGLKAE